MLHPNETKMIKETLRYAELHRKIRDFVSSVSSKSIGGSVEETNVLPKGLYIESLANSIDFVLDSFRQKMQSLEKRHIKNSDLPLSYFSSEIKEFETILHFLKEFIEELKAQKCHGCAILGLLQKHSFHADLKTIEAIKTIRQSIYSVFLQQLSHWLIYGKLVDKHQEFFIVRCDDTRIAKQADNGTITTTSMSSSEPINENIALWRFQIVYSKIPPIFSTSFAEKVLFIGQTVRMLIDDPRKTAKKVSVWNYDDEHGQDVESIWDNKEHIFFNKIQSLYNNNIVNIGAYEQVVNEIKLYVTKRLSQAFNQADLIKHLKMFKDYFLLGRGELFLEFIIQLNKIEALDGVNENLARDVNQAFQKALSYTAIDIDHPKTAIDFNLMKIIQQNRVDSTDSNLIKLIRLNFNVKWPLHLFFSPLVLDRYGELFSFLLQIRQIQYELHSVWRLHREKKVPGNSLLSQLKNRMLFLIDNLQYYLQVDVVESQFSILMSAAQNSSDFEYIQRAHSVFLANVMSLSFLLNTEPYECTVNKSSSRGIENPVLTILNKIFETIQVFCKFNKLNAETPEFNEIQQLNTFEEQ